MHRSPGNGLPGNPIPANLCPIPTWKTNGKIANGTRGRTKKRGLQHDVLAGTRTTANGQGEHNASRV
jgi:hypothetical protein